MTTQITPQLDVPVPSQEIPHGPILLEFDTLNPGIYDAIDIDITFGSLPPSPTVLEPNVYDHDVIVSPHKPSTNENDVSYDHMPSRTAESTEFIPEDDQKLSDAKQDTLTFDEFKRIMEDFKANFTLTPF